MATATDILNRVTHQLNSRLGIRHIFLRMTDSASVTKSETVLNDMARLAWFNGIVFDGVGDKEMTKIRKIVEYYHPNSSFGYYGDIKNNETKNISSFDFVILPVNAANSSDEIRDRILKVTGIPTKLFIEVKVEDGDDRTLPGVIDMIRNLGIKHYGVSHAQDLHARKNEYTHAYDMAKGTLAVFGG
jgi:hypothetical protein